MTTPSNTPQWKSGSFQVSTCLACSLSCDAPKLLWITPLIYHSCLWLQKTYSPERAIFLAMHILMVIQMAHMDKPDVTSSIHVAPAKILVSLWVMVDWSTTICWCFLPTSFSLLNVVDWYCLSSHIIDHCWWFRIIHSYIAIFFGLGYVLVVSSW